MKAAAHPGAMRHGAVVRARRRAQIRRLLEWNALQERIERDLEFWSARRDATMSEGSKIITPSDESTNTGIGPLGLFKRLFGGSAS